jgi:hypothetical protein
MPQLPGAGRLCAGSRIARALVSLQLATRDEREILKLR